MELYDSVTHHGDIYKKKKTYLIALEFEIHMWMTLSYIQATYIGQKNICITYYLNVKNRCGKNGKIVQTF